MGLHTGEGVPGGDNYVGIDVNRTARISAAGHGGQIVMSEATRVLVAGGGTVLRDARSAEFALFPEQKQTAKQRAREKDEGAAP